MPDEPLRTVNTDDASLIEKSESSQEAARETGEAPVAPIPINGTSSSSTPNAKQPNGDADTNENHSAMPQQSEADHGAAAVIPDSSVVGGLLMASHHREVCLGRREP